MTAVMCFFSAALAVTGIEPGVEVAESEFLLQMMAGDQRQVGSGLQFPGGTVDFSTGLGHLGVLPGSPCEGRCLRYEYFRDDPRVWFLGLVS